MELYNPTGPKSQLHRETEGFASAMSYYEVRLFLILLVNHQFTDFYF